MSVTALTTVKKNKFGLKLIKTENERKKKGEMEGDLTTKARRSYLI